MNLKTIYYLTFMALIITLAFYFQTKVFFSPDVDYLLYASNQLLHHAKYGPDIFETNPPMILYFYIPAILLAKTFSIPLITSLRCYLYFFIILSLTLCSFLLKKIIKNNDNIVRHFIFYTITGSLLFLPNIAFAQREHVLMILILPYLLSSVLALENKSINPLLACLIGVMAGVGFSLKPFFLITPCLIELYFIIKKRQPFAWIRIETAVILSILILYLLSIFIFQPGYIYQVLPFVSRYYFQGVALPWGDFVFFENILFCMSIGVSYFFYCKHDSYRSLGMIVELALIGMIVAFLIPKTPWFYHVLPSLILSLIIIASILGQAIASCARKNLNHYFFRWDSIIILMGLAMVLVFPLHYQHRLTNLVKQFHHDHPMNAVSDYINQQTGPHSLACFALGTADCFPYVFDTNSIYAQRYPSFWWYRGLRYDEKTHPSEKMTRDKNTLIDYFAEDLNRYHPRWVAIDEKHFKILENNQFDIVNYFLTNEKFRLAWQHYRYLLTLNSIKLYERIS